MDPRPARKDQTAKDQVQRYIDNTLTVLLDELSSPDGHPTITLKRRSRTSGFYIHPDNGALKASETDKHVSYTWPGKDAHEAWRFSKESKLPLIDCTCRIHDV